MECISELKDSLNMYFGCFKGRGFNFEDTHITDKALKDSPKSTMFIIWFIMKFILMSTKQ